MDSGRVESIDEYIAQFEPHMQAKGSIQFPLDEPLPVDLIRRMVEFRVAENTARAASRTRKR
jgi:uncharacterized protein YdhG (YjbR/CyaY superfamily)